MSDSARYLVGIDLGTSNIAVAYLDLAAEDAFPQVFSIPQVISEGEVEARDLLPSFIYLPEPNSYSRGALDLPWAADRSFCVGGLARRNAALQPGKTVSSGKSWLCVSNVDRLAAILPWNRQDPERQLSPVDAARLCLEHVRDAWNHTMAAENPEARFERQDVVLTVPASFDAVARELTVKAAQEAGIEVALLEEPQAAFYAWLQERASDWRKHINAGDRVLVCDIGGGTTDFSLIEVEDEDGDLALKRVAVGEHILLGGDNMDLTLAYIVAQRLQTEQGVRLDAYQLAGLTHACREAKEALCAAPDSPPRQLTVLGRGSSVIGGAISTQLSFADLEAALLDGFFPPVEFGAGPAVDTGSGLRAFGLRYAADPAVTRHLSAFLARHCREDDGGVRMPVAVLFNGGVAKAEILRQRVVDALTQWRSADVPGMGVLAADDPDRAVARGACWYAKVRRGEAIRIKAGSPHSYYVGVASSMPAVPGFSPPLEALCVTPLAMEEGTELDVPASGLGLVVGDTTEFRFFASTSRRDDVPGTRCPDAADPELHELPPLAAELPAEDENTPAGTLVPVSLHTVLSEIGTLQLWCLEQGGGRRWKLEYELRATDLDGPGQAAAAGEGTADTP